jgi:uncharacterized protein (DUF58 family)
VDRERPDELVPYVEEAPRPERLPAGPPGEAERERAWTPTRALGRAVLLVGVLTVAAVLLGRVDLVVLAAPFALGTAVALGRMPRHLPEVTLTVHEPFVGEGQPIHLTLAAGNPGRVPYDYLVVRTALPPWLRIRDGDRPFLAPVPAASVAEVPLEGRALRWGRHHLGPVLAHAVACDALLVSDGLATPPYPLKVFPVTEPFEADEAMPRAAGMVGFHRSRRPGQGGELAGVRVFGPGDRLRRIDWRVSLRTRQLHVAATLSDRDAEIVLLLDVLNEAGRSGGVAGSASVLDTTVRAAAGIAEHYLHRGDRVSLLEYGMRGRRLRPASGRRQYVTVLEWLLDVRPATSGYDPPPSVFGAQMLSPDALVVVRTPLLDARSAAMVARLVRAGRFVIAVDTLPPDVALPVRGDSATLAARLWRLDRDNLLGQLREHGVPVVAWAGTGSLDEVLRDVARLASAPKAGRR